MSHGVEPPAVLTVEEVAAYLRLPTDTIPEQAAQGSLPGRQIADTWRFLRAAIDAWLWRQDSCPIRLQQAGALADDPSLAALRSTLYASRNRPEVEQD